jgi:hypothetical protein
MSTGQAKPKQMSMPASKTCATTTSQPGIKHFSALSPAAPAAGSKRHAPRKRTG